MLAFIVGLHAEARLLRPLRRPVFVGGGDAAGAAIAVARAQAAGASALVQLRPGRRAGSRSGAGQPDRPARRGRQCRPQSAAEAIGLGARWLHLRHRVGSASIVASAIDKAALFAASGAAAVDLESGSVAAAGLPFGVLRAVAIPPGVICRRPRWRRWIAPG